MNYIQHLYSSNSPSWDDVLSELLPYVINSDDNDHLCAMPSVEEIKHAIDHIGALKAPGPKEMFALFYQFYWNVVQSDLIQMVIKFF